jgi:nucleoside-diphosphate-sugar epimerase
MFVAGATGFIGHPFIKMALEKGYAVQALSRSAESVAKIQALGAQPVEGDLLTVGSWQAVARQANFIVHIAQPMTFGGRVGKDRALNYERDRLVMDNNLLDGDHKASRILYVSGTSYYGHQATPADETTTPNPRGWGPYIVKAVAAIEARRKGGQPILMAFPSSVYGAGSWYAGILANIYQEKQSLTIAGRDSLLATVHVEDCARALLHLLEKGDVQKHYFICDDVPQRYSQILEKTAAALNKPLKDRAIPAFFARWLAGPVVTDSYDANLINHRLKSSGFTFTYPTVETGFPAVTKEWLEKQAQM